MTRWDDPAVARKVLTSYRTFVVVGCSSDPHRPSHGVARYLLSQGYEVVPVNPNESEVLGRRCYADLASLPDDLTPEVVDIFRRSEAAGTHVDEAIAAGARAVWMQLGVIDEGAAQRAAAAGLEVVMDRCPARDHPILVLGGRR